MHCYVYRIDENHNRSQQSMECRKTGSFALPIRRTRKGEYKIPSGTAVYTCFTSDFFIKDADEWRDEAWNIIRRRSDCSFIFYTKRIDRIYDCLPDDWGDGYDNVTIGCTAENQKMADCRLPIFLAAPIKHRIIGVEPILEKIDISAYLDSRIESVSVGGESGEDARVCDYKWVLDIREQCRNRGISFSFHQTGANFVKDGRHYSIPRGLQGIQARKANIDI